MKKNNQKNVGFSDMKMHITLLFDDQEIECFPGPEYHLLDEIQKEK